MTKKKLKLTVIKEVPYDRVTVFIAGLLLSFPKIGKHLSNIYLWKPLMFNYMFVGASGTVLSWVLYEGIFRSFVAGFWGGTFLGMVATTILVFLWNYTWNRHWSLNPKAQVIRMKRVDLLELKALIDDLLDKEKTD